ncbi:hypothetical protein ABW21_db0205695 [Orbilia brochopaga]|nr:hypothetical protein ABW21_db0205695 [Drechslerella brochopaga]
MMRELCPVSIHSVEQAGSTVLLENARIRFYVRPTNHFWLQYQSDTKSPAALKIIYQAAALVDVEVSREGGFCIKAKPSQVVVEKLSDSSTTDTSPTYAALLSVAEAERFTVRFKADLGTLTIDRIRKFCDTMLREGTKDRELMEEQKSLVRAREKYVSPTQYCLIQEEAINREFAAYTQHIAAIFNSTVQLDWHDSKKGSQHQRISVKYPASHREISGIYQIAIFQTFKIECTSNRSLPDFVAGVSVEQAGAFNETGDLSLTIFDIFTQHQGASLSSTLKIAKAKNPTPFYRLTAIPNGRHFNRLKHAVAQISRARDTPINYEKIIMGTPVGTHDHILPTNFPDTNTYGLDSGQAAAIRMVFCSRCGPEPCIISGPAGCGKSRTAAIIAQLAIRAYNAPGLICAETSNATVSILGAVDEIYSASGQNPGLVLVESSARKLDDTRRSGKLGRLIEKYSFEAQFNRWCEEEGPFPQTLTEKDRENKFWRSRKILFHTLAMSEEISGQARTLFQPRWVIIDEAPSAVECLVMMCLNAYKQSLKKVILVGDLAQRQPYALSTNPKDNNYVLHLSLPERLERSNFPVTLLKVQHRTCAEITELLREVVYNNRSCLFPRQRGDEKVYFLESDTADPASSVRALDTQPALRRALHTSPVVFVDVRDGLEEIAGVESIFNQREVQDVRSLVKHLLLEEKLPGDSIAILAPYKAQLKRLRLAMPAALEAGVEIASIDAFVGREKDVVILSMVRSNASGSVSLTDHLLSELGPHAEENKANDFQQLGFTKNAHRLTTAISRAKRNLVVFGNFEFLFKASGSGANGKNAGMRQFMNNYPWSDKIYTLQRFR